jgi:hypothetical protein
MLFLTFSVSLCCYKTLLGKTRELATSAEPNNVAAFFGGASACIVFAFHTILIFQNFFSRMCHFSLLANDGVASGKKLTMWYLIVQHDRCSKSSC